MIFSPIETGFLISIILFPNSSVSSSIITALDPFGIIPPVNIRDVFPVNILCFGTSPILISSIISR